MQHRRVAGSEAALLGRAQAAVLREQFIAVLGHDLRNPLASIAAGARLLAKAAGPRTAHRSGADAEQRTRMAGLIDNVLDFARGRLGGGLDAEPLARAAGSGLEQVIAELRSGLTGTEDRDRVRTDTRRSTATPARIAQLLSNLLANALTHGAADRPVCVRAPTKEACSNFRRQCRRSDPSDALNRLFQPFFRGRGRPVRALAWGFTSRPKSRAPMAARST